MLSASQIVVCIYRKKNIVNVGQLGKQRHSINWSLGLRTNEVVKRIITNDRVNWGKRKNSFKWMMI